MKLLQLPIPVLVAVAQIDVPPEMATGPAWVSVFLAGVFVVLWALNAMGKLPGGGSERRAVSYTPADRDRDQVVLARLTEIHEIVTEKEPGVAGWRLVWAPRREIVETRDSVRALADLARVWDEDRKTWAAERANLLERITKLEDIVRTQDAALRKEA